MFGELFDALKVGFGIGITVGIIALIAGILKGIKDNKEAEERREWERKWSREKIEKTKAAFRNWDRDYQAYVWNIARNTYNDRGNPETRALGIGIWAKFDGRVQFISLTDQELYEVCCFMEESLRQ